LDTIHKKKIKNGFLIFLYFFVINYFYGMLNLIGTMKHLSKCALMLGVLTIGASFGAKDVKKIIFEEQRIEGKIRRPQLVLIKADLRPEFEPMIMQDLGKSGKVAGAVSDDVINDSPYNKAFRFQDTKINNYVR